MRANPKARFTGWHGLWMLRVKSGGYSVGGKPTHVLNKTNTPLPRWTWSFNIITSSPKIFWVTVAYLIYMNSTNTTKRTLNRSSCRLIKSALSTASSRVSSDKYRPTPSSPAGLTSYYIVDKTFESKNPVRVTTEKFFLQCGQPLSTDGPNTYSMLSVGNLFNSRYYDAGTTQVATENCS